MQLSQPLRGGDAVFFWGAHDFLSSAIEAITHGPSHSGTIFDPDLPLPNGEQQKELYIIESTILDGVNGVQLNTLASRVNSYDGVVAAAYLNDQYRRLIDWHKFWACGLAKLGVVKYNIPEIGAYLLNEFVLPGELQLDKSNPNAVVCSELRAEMLQAGGVAALDPYRDSPAPLFRARMYSGIDAIAGVLTPKMLAHFNTV